MNLLITIDENYIIPFKVMLHSLFMNDPDKIDCTIYLLHSNIRSESIADLGDFCTRYNAKLVPITVDASLFKSAPTTKRYPKEMYYRLLSPLILPSQIDRVLYLDPDILIINSLKELCEIDLGENSFAAASHTSLTEVTNEINYARLNIGNEYFNTGVMLIDLNKARNIVKADDIFECVKEYGKELILPDQDVFNILYGNITLPIDDAIWNYDVRKYPKYLVRSAGKHNRKWVMENTSILHFCGRNKPWKDNCKNPFGLLYLHYKNHLERSFRKQSF